MLFNQFIFKDYEQLFFASYMNGPVTLNQTMYYLSTLNSKKIALLCFDGMGFSEWVELKKYLKDNKIWNIKEKATFALIPTVTGISRMALFSGKVATNKIVSEAAGFQAAVHQLFSEGKSLKKCLFRNTDGKWQRDYLNYDILGIVYSIIDSVAHGMTLLSKSKKTMHNNLKELFPESQIAESITRLLAEGYQVFITADHGSIWCWGNGISTDKYLVEDRARRALVYPNPRLAEEFAERHEVILLPSQGNFEDKVLVFPRGREMFHTRDKLEISHGGIHIEEVIIPFVEVFP